MNHLRERSPSLGARAFTAALLLIASGCGGAASGMPSTPTPAATTTEPAVEAAPTGAPTHEADGFDEGVAYEYARGVPFDLALARDAYRRACERSDARACAAWGHTLTMGPPAGRDVAHALELFRSACEHGAELGCVHLVLATDGNEVASNAARSERLATFERACSAGEAFGCTRLGMERMTPNASAGTRVDPARRAEEEEQAVAAFTTACEASEPSACAELAKAYGWGRGVQADASRVTPLIERACELGHFQSCAELVARYELQPPNIARDRGLYERACTGGFVDACGFLAGMYRYGIGVARDETRVFELLLFACTQVPDRCIEFGHDYVCENSESFDADRAAQFFERACASGNSSSCGVRSVHCVPESESE